MKEQYRDTDVAKKMYFIACSDSFSKVQPAKNFFFQRAPQIWLAVSRADETAGTHPCCQQGSVLPGFI